MSKSSSRPGVTRASRSRVPLGLALVLSFFAALILPSASLADTTAPKLISSSVSPSGWINVTGSAQTVTVTFRVADADGVLIPAVSGTSDLSKDSTGLGQVSLVSGTAQDGVYEAKLIVGKGSVGGSWTARAITLTDGLGNTAANVVLGHFTVFAFGWDTVPPVLVDSSITPTSVDVTNAPATITATLHITDDYAGTKSPVVVASSSDFQQNSDVGSVTLVSGDKNDGVYAVAVTIPQHAAAGTWVVRLLPLSDTSGNLDPTIRSLGSVAVKSDAAAPVQLPGTNTTTNTTTVVNNSSSTQVQAPGTAVLGTSVSSKPYLTLVSTSGKKGVKITKSGKVSLKLKCNGAAACRGSVRVYYTVKGKKNKIVSRRVSVKAGATVTARFTLTKVGKKVVRTGKKAKTSVSIWTDGIAAPRTKALTVKRAVK